MNDLESDRKILGAIANQAIAALREIGELEGSAEWFPERAEEVIRMAREHAVLLADCQWHIQP